MASIKDIIRAYEILGDYNGKNPFILRLKREINFLMLVNLIIAIAFIISTYDSIKIRDQIWDDHTAQVEEIVEHYCGEEPWQN
jgi:hypothetical protein